jgi:flagellar biosynthesis protein FlhG
MVMKSIARDPVSRIIPLPRVHRGLGMRIISITGGKGGVGKSCISVNLALSLAKLGGRILLVDGDLGLANADQLLGVHAPSTLLDVLEGRQTLKEAVVETAHGISLLPACSGRQEMAELDLSTRTNLLAGIKSLDGEYDFVVVDTAAGIGETALSLASAGNQILAVATPDPTSARDVFAVMKILSKDFGARNISLIPNMVLNQAEGMTLYQKIARVTDRFLPLSLRLGGIVTRDPNLAKSVRERSPLVTTYPQAPAVKQISEIAQRVITIDREMSFMDDIEGNEEDLS